MTINGANSYDSDHFANAASAHEYMPGYLYTSYITDVYVGSSVNVMATFKIPEGDLAPGRTITLEDTQIPALRSSGSQQTRSSTSPAARSSPRQWTPRAMPLR